MVGLDARGGRLTKAAEHVGDPSEKGDRPSLLIPTVLIFVVGIAYGSTFSANKIAIGAGFPYIAYTFWVALFAALMLLILAAATSNLPKLSPAHLRQYAVVALFGVMGPVTVFAFVASKLPAGVITLVLMLTPALTYVFSFIARIERFRLLSMFGLALGAVGVLLIVLPEQSLPTAGSWVWILVALIASVSAALANVTAALLRPPATTTLSLATGLLVVAAIGMLPIMLGIDGWVLFADMPWTGVWAMLWAAAANAITFWCFLECVRMAGPVFFSQHNYVIVTAGILWAFALFGEQFSPWLWGALALMAGGLYMVNAGMKQSVHENQLRVRPPPDGAS